MTPLIDRYLQNVRISLPAARRDDIVRELAEDIRAQIADREEELGRALTDDEQEAVLKHFGHPLVLATRYGPQRHVIGPALFPVYWMTLKIALGGALAVNVALAIAFLVGGSPPGRAIGHLASFPFTIAMTVFGWVTLVFALLDLNLPRLLQHAWVDLRGLTLPPVDGKGRRWTLIAEIVGSTAFLIWWLALPQSPFLVFGPGRRLPGAGADLAAALHADRGDLARQPGGAVGGAAAPRLGARADDRPLPHRRPVARARDDPAARRRRGAAGARRRGDRLNWSRRSASSTRRRGSSC